MSDTSSVTVERVEIVDERLTDSLAALVPQMSTSAPAVTRDWVQTIVSSDSSTLYVAMLDGNVVGTLTLVLYPIPVGLKAWIEDVIVDERARGRGIGKQLVEVALDDARARGARSVMLTSRPAREAANRLYQRLGFARHETNLYKFALQLSTSQPCSS